MFGLSFETKVNVRLMIVCALPNVVLLSDKIWKFCTFIWIHLFCVDRIVSTAGTGDVLNNFMTSIETFKLKKKKNHRKRIHVFSQISSLHPYHVCDV